MSWGLSEIAKASQLGDRRNTLPTPSGGTCPKGWSFYGGTCLPSVGSDLAEEWNWQDNKHTEADKNYYNLETNGIWARPSEIYSATGSKNDWQDYLQTGGECVNEGGVWMMNGKPLTATEVKFGQRDGHCAFKKGIVPKFLQASRIHDKAACEAKGFEWDDKWYRKSYCYYVIGKEDRKDTSKVIGSGVVTTIDKAAHLGEDVLDTGGWLVKNWKTVAVVAGGVVLFVILRK